MSNNAAVALTAKEISNTTRCLKNNKASREEHLPTETYKHAADTIAPCSFIYVAGHAFRSEENVLIRN